MKQLHRLFESLQRIFPAAWYLLVAAAVILWFSTFYQKDKGFTSLIAIGDAHITHLNPKLLAQNPYIETSSYGYDAQHYVQLALSPDVKDPSHVKGVDNVAYRARRMLFCWIPYALAAGNPKYTVLFFTLENIVCWICLGILLLRWFNPNNIKNALAWTGVMLSIGMIGSIRNSLLDGPSLLLIAIGLRLAELQKTWLSALVLGISGLGKETNILTGSIFLPSQPNRDWRNWGRATLQMAAVVGPVLFWTLYLTTIFDSEHLAGSGGNLRLPFVAYIEKWNDVLHGLSVGDPYARISLLMLISLTCQSIWFIRYPRISCIWWRIGASYVFLMSVLGPAVWEGVPGAAARVLLPLVLAFNVSAILRRASLVWLVVGNLTIISSIETFTHFKAQTDHEIYGVDSFQSNAEGKRWIVKYNSNWTGAERSFEEYWRWGTKPSCVLTIENPTGKSVPSIIRFQMKSGSPDTVGIVINGSLLAQRELTFDHKTPFEFSLDLNSGETRVEFKGLKTESTNAQFCVRNFEVRLLGTN